MKNGSSAANQSGVTVLPFYCLEKCSKPTLFLAYLRLKGFRCQSIALSFSKLIQRRKPLVLICSPYGRQWKYPKLSYEEHIYV